MTDFIKISGKKWSIPEKTETTWKWTKRPGGWWIAEAPDGRRRRIEIARFRKIFGMNSHGFLFHGEWGSESHGGGGDAGGGDTELVAQFPGKVRKILVQEGAQVAVGDSLLLVEAMKMEFAVKAPFAGRVVKILVTEGQQLSPGVQFLDLEEMEPKRE